MAAVGVGAAHLEPFAGVLALGVAVDLAEHVGAVGEDLRQRDRRELEVVGRRLLGRIDAAIDQRGDEAVVVDQRGADAGVEADLLVDRPGIAAQGAFLPSLGLAEHRADQAVEQLEAICFGARTAAGVMADAIVPGSRLEIFEDVDGQTFTISMQARFADGHVGRFEIRYDRGSDYYVVVGTDTHLDVCFDVLADVIGRELGAANWGQVRIDFEKYQRRVA